ncbi:MAG: hypothetical protein Aurels2KO_12510 [Aureliella sp.]
MTRLIGALTCFAGVLVLIIAVLAYLELRSAATSPTPPSPDAMPLTKIFGPELFETGSSGRKPVEIARDTINRIYLVGGVSLSFMAIGTLLLMFKQSPRAL